MKKVHDRNANKFVVVLSRRFVLCTVVCAVFGAFGVGTCCRLLVRTTKRQKEHDALHYVSHSQIHGETAPGTISTSKIFDSETAALASFETTLLGGPIGVTKLTKEYDSEDDDDVGDDDDNDKVNGQSNHDSSGHHLSVDIHGVDKSILSSKKRLQCSMLEFAAGAKISLLSCHCLAHRAWNSCIGISLRSHVSFQTCK